MPIITEDTVRRKSGDGALGAYEALLYSDSGDLTQFGVVVEILSPGARTSYPHWHESEDELVYVLDGTVTLIEGDNEDVLTTGAAATFQAGVEVPHTFVNRSDAPVRLLIVGTRAPRDRVHYPTEDRVQHIERSSEEERRWSRLNGAPAEPLQG
ncbi:cupin domain-containing protein [Antarctobacter jejuensis]|uniref:cupin domain-containing protein n=1 Tax=Antarctobacter jejuensis TaxID=1439938 RepID=UPI003FD67E07